MLWSEETNLIFLTIVMETKQGTRSPTKKPTAAPTAQVFELETTYEGRSSRNGNFFDIVVLNDIRLKGVKVNLQSGFTDANVAVFYHLGSYTGVMESPESWTQPFEPISVDFSQSGVGTTITFPTPIVLIGGGTTYGFYITRTGNGELLYSDGSSEGALYVQDANVQIKVGRGVDYPFGSTSVPRIWNGAIVYELATEAPTTKKPTTGPTKKPTTVSTSS
jgi:hypothetical protein